MREWLPSYQGAKECFRVVGLILGGLTLFGYMTVSAVVLWDKALTPIPQPREPSPADRHLAHDLQRRDRELLDARGENARLQVENAALRVRLDGLRRSAILFPQRDPELAPEDMIPPQALPIPERIED